MTQRLFYISLLILLLSSCNEQKKEVEGILDANKFEQVLVDMQLIEAHVSEVRINQVFIKDSIDYYYNEMFNRHGITQKEFESTIDYYAGEPQLLKEIYENVLETISGMEAELANVQTEQKVIIPIGKHMMADIIAETRMYKFFVEDSINLDVVRDSLFKFFILNDSLLTKRELNVASFQQSFNNVTHLLPMYVSFKEEILEKAKIKHELK